MPSAWNFFYSLIQALTHNILSIQTHDNQRNTFEDFSVTPVSS